MKNNKKLVVIVIFALVLLVMGILVFNTHKPYDDVNKLENIVDNFYKSYLNESYFRKIDRTNLSLDLINKIDLAIKKEDDNINKLKAQNSTDKPDIIEGDIFTSLYEGATSYLIESSIVENEKATVVMKFENNKWSDLLPWNDDIILIKENNSWKIDDIIYSDIQRKDTEFGSLKNLLNEYIKIKADYLKTDYYTEIGFDLMLNESVGFLKYNLPTSEIIKEIGNPKEKSEAVESWIDGLIHQLWFYKTKGIELDMMTENEKDGQVISNITIKSPCKYLTSTGHIGIGSSKNEVLTAYKNGINLNDYFQSEKQIVVGSVYGGIIFGIENDIVSSIFIGAAAE